MGNPGNVSTVVLRLFRLLNEFQRSGHLSATFRANAHYTPTHKHGQLENKKIENIRAHLARAHPSSLPTTFHIMRHISIVPRQLAFEHIQLMTRFLNAMPLAGVFDEYCFNTGSLQSSVELL